MKRSRSSLETTRRTILDALAHTIVESNGTGFSVQQVADRAGVTHRTVYNHFPTRDALSEGLADYFEVRLAEEGTVKAPDAGVTLERFPEVVGALYGMLARQEVYARAYVLLMMANRTAPRVWRARMRRFEKTIPEDRLAPAGLSARQIASAIRMFASTLGWHTLTEHCGLSTEEAVETAAWATRTLVDALGPAKSREPASAGMRSASKRRGATKKTAKGDSR